MKYELPNKFWPVTLDNFFDNPDEIRELGLRLLKSDKAIKPSDDDTQGGRWPGIRSPMLWEIDNDLTQRIIEKVMSCYFNLDLEEISWNFCDMQFQLMHSYDKDKNNIKNKGWIHRDGSWELAGLIYLTPDIERDSGTSLFNIKSDKTFEEMGYCPKCGYWDETGRNNINKAAEARKPLYSGDPVNYEELKEKWEEHRSYFIEKVRFENIYNRLIMYDAREWHAGNSYYSAKDNRMLLIFFIGGINTKKWPLQRINKINS